MSDYCKFLVNGVCTYDISGVLAERDRYKAEAMAWKRRCEAAEKVIYGIEKGYDEENMAEVYDPWRQQVKDMEVKG